MTFSTTERRPEFFQRLVAAAFALTLLSACAGDGPDEEPVEAMPEPAPGSEVDFATQIQPVLDEHCSCHVAVSPPQGLSLREGASYDNLVDVPSVERPDLLLVEPGDPDRSYLVIKIDDRVPDVASLRVGDRMPVNLPPVPTSDIDLIRQWISEGAPREADRGDGEPPEFEGAERAQAVSSAEIDVFWTAAVDDVSPAQAIIYSVFVATESGAQDFTEPDHVAAAGTTSLRVGSLAAATDYFVVVRAEDEAGNRDANERELTVRTLDLPGTMPPEPEPQPEPEPPGTVPNQPPVADPGGPYEALVGDAISFAGTGSTDPEGDLLEFAWDFGDGNTATGETVEHAYASAGTFTVRLVVSDGEFESEPAETTATIEEASPFPQDPVVSRVCSQCHGLRVILGDGTVVDLSPPGEGLAFFPEGTFRTGRVRSAQAWESTVGRMRRHVDSREETDMTDEEQAQIIRFLGENYSDGN